MTTVMGLVIPYDERRKAYMRRIDGEGDELSTIVGGPLEMVRLSPNSHMYINEEAKLSFPPMPYNISANRILQHTPFRLPRPNALFMGPLGEGMTDKDGNDFIAGNAVILGSHMAPAEGDVQGEVMVWCDKAGVEVVQQVSGLNVPRDGSARRIPESRIVQLARAERAAREAAEAAGVETVAAEREMMERGRAIREAGLTNAGAAFRAFRADSYEPTEEMLIQPGDVQRALLAEADEKVGGILGMTREQQEARKRVMRAAEAGTPGANDPYRVWSRIVPDEAVRGRHRDQEG